MTSTNHCVTYTVYVVIVGIVMLSSLLGLINVVLLFVEIKIHLFFLYFLNKL